MNDKNSATIDNLMPSVFPTLGVIPPVVILRQQAVYLKQATNGVIEGAVYSDEGDNDTIIHSFYLKAPLLDNYHYHVLSISHFANAPYPAHLWYDVTTGYDADAPEKNGLTMTLKNSGFENESDLRKRLSEIFASEKFIQIVASLRAQSVVPEEVSV